ncbi:cytochrome C assembly family protein [Desulfurispira natronophila]|uniref:ABC-type uncharacterized transport system permease subunit n=1 Tax=Desulfurispira natronophila TaxID=682562 RepID=A0A7W7Y600_9BACT|nr:cytochrome c biogenesis protein CcsA [Desulfurispira natronophila]MBB5022735.1 ABC-type uncharacterized transport system permease subunit [Desulfurispira natronophila]
MMVTILQHASFVAYVLSSIFFFRYISKDSERTVALAYGTAIAGLIFQVFPMAVIIREAGYFPLENPLLMLSLFSVCILCIFLAISLRHRFAISGTFVMPLVCFAAAGQLVASAPSLSLPEPLRSWMFTMHIMLVTLAFSFFFLCASTAVFYLIMENQLKGKRQGALFHRIPSVLSLVRIKASMLLWGFASYTLALVVSLYWSLQIYGVAVLPGDPKVLVSVATWALYGGLLLATRLGVMDPRQSAYAVIGSLVLVVLALFGVGHIFPRDQL